MKTNYGFAIVVVVLILVSCISAEANIEPTSVSLTAVPTKTEPSPSSTPAPTDTPTPEPPTINIEEIYGTWVYAGHIFFQYNPDHTFAYAFSEASLADGPLDFGTFELDGSTFTFVSDPESAGCEPGRRGVYEISFPYPNRLEFVLIEDTCHDSENPAMTRMTPIEKAMVDDWQFKENPLYYLQITNDGQICYGDSLEAAAEQTICNSYVLESNLITETCGENNPECDAGQTCLASVKINIYDQLEYQVIPGNCDWDIHNAAAPYASHQFIRQYP
ncbi:MAG: hypothetical protein KC413_09440 [Anaerolineales bacterium]|nr:hypothetical protein [Anaerolineales bacterium]